MQKVERSLVLAIVSTRFTKFGGRAITTHETTLNPSNLFSVLQDNDEDFFDKVVQPNISHLIEREIDYVACYEQITGGAFNFTRKALRSLEKSAVVRLVSSSVLCE